MRRIAEWSIFCEATSAEFWILHRADGVAIGIDEVHCSGNANRSAIGIDEDLHVIAHYQLLIEVIAKRL